MKFWVFELMVIVGLFHHLAGNEGFGRSAENGREERDGREDIILRDIILMSKKGK